MNWKRILFKTPNIYFLLDEKTVQAKKLNLLSLAKKACNCPYINIIQLRLNICDKKKLELARKIKGLCTKKPLIINNRPDIASLSKSGLHLGQNDIPITEARKITKTIIGITAHNKKEIIAAQKSNPDYISIGTVFKSKIKPDLANKGVKKIKNMVKYINSNIPFFVIGGINATNIRQIKTAGILRVVVGEFLTAADICKRANLLYKQLENNV